VDDVTIVRAVHVLSVVLWIGGVGFVTTVILPAVRRLKAAEDRLTFFDTLERRFAWQARITTLFTGLTGLHMVIRLELWDRFLSVNVWKSSKRQRKGDSGERSGARTTMAALYPRVGRNPRFIGSGIYFLTSSCFSSASIWSSLSWILRATT
jgi:hypothetical protein